MCIVTKCRPALNGALRPGSVWERNAGNKSRENRCSEVNMVSTVLRKIIQIDEDKCNGCGICIDSCAEGALALIDGKARLVKEKYCDGLAACLKECPQGALRIVEREAENFDETETKAHIQELTKNQPEQEPCGCPGAAVRRFEKATSGSTEPLSKQESMLSHWPVQLTLVPPGAKFLNNSDVVLVADCVPFAYPGLHSDFLKGNSVLVACPKLDNAEAHLTKLTEIIKKSNLKSLTVVRMEVPCCGGLSFIAKKAIALSGINLPFKEVVIGIKGNLISPSNNIP
jgi:NAD-dependent dihydropyrimidine dehydrogenase PreA subunit